ncbi:MAG: prepilin-type N-terminal cleavage/methylation domain-containing protein, partial [Dehalococcoidia bacterium]
MKTYKNIGFGPRKGKKGFTLIELLIVMVILAILAGVVVMAIGGVFGTSRERAYDVSKQ